MGEPGSHRIAWWATVAGVFAGGRLIVTLLEDGRQPPPSPETTLWTLPVDLMAGIAEFIDRSAAVGFGSAKLLAAVLGSIAFAAALYAVRRS